MTLGGDAGREMTQVCYIPISYVRVPDRHPRVRLQAAVLGRILIHEAGETELVGVCHGSGFPDIGRRTWPGNLRPFVSESYLLF